jgi:hypothetical protein
VDGGRRAEGVSREVREDPSAPAEFWRQAEPECDWARCQRPVVKAFVVFDDGVFRAHVVACSGHAEPVEAGRIELRWEKGPRVVVSAPGEPAQRRR